MESLLPLIISLASGAAGGNVAGALMKKFSLGLVGNSLVGILGGGLGSQLLGMVGGDMGGILGSVAGGGVGGGALMAIIGVIKSAMSKG